MASCSVPKQSEFSEECLRVEELQCKTNPTVRITAHVAEEPV